jgi:hypothetical protein
MRRRKGEVGGGGAVVELGRVAETLKGEPGVRRPSRCGKGWVGTVLSCARFPLLFLELVELRHFQSQ